MMPGRTLSSMNILDGEHRYDENQLAAARRLAPFLVASFVVDNYIHGKSTSRKAGSADEDRVALGVGKTALAEFPNLAFIDWRTAKANVSISLGTGNFALAMR